jgi:hypothetical protein
LKKIFESKGLGDYALIVDEAIWRATAALASDPDGLIGEMDEWSLTAVQNSFIRATRASQIRRGALQSKMLNVSSSMMVLR